MSIISIADMRRQREVPTESPVGKRIRLIHMPDDPKPIEPGTIGKCMKIDCAGNLIMIWENLRCLSLIPGVDEYEILPD